MPHRSAKTEDMSQHPRLLKSILLCLGFHSSSVSCRTTDVLHLCLIGGWAPVLMFRRPFMSVLDKVFHLVDSQSYSASCPKLVRLTRPVAHCSGVWHL